MQRNGVTQWFNALSQVYTWPDGGVYDGQWVDGSEHGIGMLTNPDGSQFKGEFVGGMRHGEGLLLDSDGEVEQYV